MRSARILGRLCQVCGFVLIWILPGLQCRDGATGLLPPEWSGKWFESGSRDLVYISSHNISHKGQCVKKWRSNYIFQDDQEGTCHRCLYIHQKHSSVLQYKESKCIHGQRNFKDICATISVDLSLQTLLRDSAPPEDCPIQGTYQFSYSRGHGLCQYPMSTLSQCEDKSKLVFHYQACADVKGSESHEERADCIAKWKEGSTYYFLARMNHSHIIAGDLEKTFRCFVYKRIYHGYLVSQSGDAKCNLYTAVEGYRTMKLKQMSTSSSQCVLPDWVRHHRKFHNLDMSEEFHINHEGTTLQMSHAVSQTHQNSADVSNADANVTLKCEKVLQNSTNHTKLVMMVNFHCSSGFKCVEVFRKTDDVFSLRIGRLSRNSDEACDQELFFDQSIPLKTITSAHHHKKPCPLMGRYKVDEGSPSKCSETPSFLLASCSKPSRIQKVHQCGKQEGAATVKSEDFVCHDTWHDTWEEETNTEQLVEYTIISPVARPSKSAKRLCLQRRYNEDAEESQLVAKTGDCFSPSTDQLWSYRISKTGSCAPVALATANGGHLVHLSLAAMLISGIVVVL